MKNRVLGGSPDKLTLSSAKRTSTENLRIERDRFVVPAFCSADLLLELDPSGEITFAARPAPGGQGAQ
ncbi:MAG: hypothetical protein VW881_00545, partial [Alphaproteobacteria bacterium]